MKKAIGLLLTMISASMYSDVNAMTKALIETAKSVERRINANQSIAKVDIDFLTRVPQAMKAISTETELQLCMEAAKKYINGSWKDKSIEELLSRVNSSMPLKTCDLLDINEAYNWRSVGRCFSQWQIFGYGFGKGSL